MGIWMVVAIQAPLLEREEELATIDRMLAMAASGRGGLVLIEGPAGIGKSRLLLAARERAEHAEFSILAARSAEHDRHVPFGLVQELVHRALRSLSSAERSELLTGPAALGARVLEDPTEETPSPAILHGLYWLIAGLAQLAPLLLIADDLQWADEPSQRLLGFLLPRAAELRLLIAVAAREGEAAQASDLLNRIAADPGAVAIRPAPLSRAAVAEIVRTTLGAAAEDRFADACQEATGGNPFLAHELARELRRDAVEPTAAEAGRVARAASVTVSRAVRARLGPLGEPAIRLVQALAVLGDAGELRHAAALAGLEPGACADLAAGLVELSVLAPGERPTFAHPLVRASVYGELGEGERSRAHRSAARLLAADGVPADRLGPHLLAVRPAGDAEVVELLRAAGRLALVRGAPEDAGILLRRALAEPPHEPLRVEVLHELGAAELRSAHPAALEHLEAALGRAAPGSAVRAQLLPLVARARWWAGRSAEATEALRREIEAAERSGATELRLRLLVELLTFATSSPEIFAGRDTLQELIGPVPAETAIGRLVLAAQAGLCVADNVAASITTDFAARALAGGLLLEEQGSDSIQWATAVVALIRADRVEEAERNLDAGLADARRRGSPHAFASVSYLRCHLAYRRGELATAEAEARAAVATGSEYGWPMTPLAYVFLIDALVEQGELEAAGAALRDAGGERDLPETWAHGYLRLSRGRLRLASGRTEEGIADLLTLGDRQMRLRVQNPSSVAWASSAAVALAGIGERERALELARDELGRAEQWGAEATIAIAQRALGLVEGGEGGRRRLGEAVALLEHTPARLELARTLTDLGAALRRANRRTDAREPLRRALDLAHVCGAAPLAARARSELVAAGGRPRRPRMRGVDALTPSERRICDLAAAGSTNAELAQSLFVTVKTVEMHLHNSYAKLGIGSRKELADALAAERPAKDS